MSDYGEFQRDLIVSNIAWRHFPRSCAIYVYLLLILIWQEPIAAYSIALISWIFVAIIKRILPINVMETNLGSLLYLPATFISLFPLKVFATIFTGIILLIMGFGIENTVFAVGPVFVIDFLIQLVFGRL